MENTLKLFDLALGLHEPWRVGSCDFSADRHRLDLRLVFTEGWRFSCPSCAAKGCPVHDTIEKEWRHMDFFQHQAFIKAKVPRVRCENCGVKQVMVPWARPGSGFTLLMEALIMELVKHMPVLPLARLLGVSDNRIWRVIGHYVEEAMAALDMSLVREVGVDETSARRGHDYITMFYDLTGRRLLHVAEGKDAETVAEFSKALTGHLGDPSLVAEVSCDMSPAFIKGVTENLPQAQVNFDKFHVVKLLTDAVDKVRRNEMRTDKTLKGSRFSLIKNPENLTKNQRDLLADVQARNAKLAEAYRLKETFRDFYKQPDRESAHGLLKGWVTNALSCGIPAMVSAAKTIRAKWAGIIRWHETHITNAVMEALNSLVQAAKRKARGYRTIKNLRLMAFLIAGKLNLKIAA